MSASPSDAELVAAARGGDASCLGVLPERHRAAIPHPGHEDVPARLFPLSPVNGEIARYFFTELAAAYDLRSRRGEITVPALLVAGAHDWVCPPPASRTPAAGLPRATLCVPRRRTLRLRRGTGALP